MHTSLTDSGASPVAGKTVLITGGTSGIGAATARLLLGRGHRVAVTGRDPGRLRGFLDDAGHADRVLGLVADASDWDSTNTAVTSAVARFGSLDAAIANAAHRRTRNPRCGIRRWLTGRPGLLRWVEPYVHRLIDDSQDRPWIHWRTNDRPAASRTAGRRPPHRPELASKRFLDRPSGRSGRTCPSPHPWRWIVAPALARRGAASSPPKGDNT
ncbi:SDR family oxidoreductase [Nonomuraea sp. NPDC050227]|uniref:SDR family oxidoreductase n=1 Tax=Nonomuraea sp. NPDC050227 TaxID=3364360 RepID=UPI0037A45BFB